MPEAPQGVFQREYPTRAEFRADIARAAARGARMLFIYTSTFDRDYNGAGQLREILGRAVPRHAVEAEVFRGADHLFSAAAHRARFFARVRRWLAEFPPPSPGAG